MQPRDSAVEKMDALVSGREGGEFPGCDMTEPSLDLREVKGFQPKPLVGESSGGKISVGSGSLQEQVNLENKKKIEKGKGLWFLLLKRLS